jgi:murein DD-endopeptidase MepM/ murein hydrolase activator NlpD
MIIRSLLVGAALTLSVGVPAAVTTTHMRGAAIEQSGGGRFDPPRDEITDAQRESIRRAIDASIEQLRRQGSLAADLTSAVDSHPVFLWPLRQATGINDPGYHGISNYVDLNPAYPGQLLDFMCGDWTYDTADGYNHAGTDFFTWPWSFRKMDRGEIEIVAAAAGQIVNKSDGNSDRSCSFNNNNWNAVFVQHADGSVAWYGHMKSGSLTPKQIGDIVTAGEFLGVVGSSGNSTGPHLHFEVHTATFDLIEPWFGPCNNLNPETWWQSQRPYDDSALNRFTTGDAAPLVDICPSTEVPHEQATFAAGATVYFTAYYRDHFLGQISHYSVLRPDGSVFSSWDHGPDQSYQASYWWWSVAIPAGEPAGIWKFKIDYQGDSQERPFTVGSPGACGRVPEMPAQGELLKLEKISTSYRLLWGASCNAKDTDYVIYEGTIGNFATYAPVRCTTSGNRAAIFSASATSRFYLVGPRNSTREGSLGTDGNGNERPPGTSSCVARFVLECP